MTEKIVKCWKDMDRRIIVNQRELVLGVAACALAIWAAAIYTSDAPAVSRGVFSGVLLVGTFLLRRYFFFFAASFVFFFANRSFDSASSE